MKNEEKDFYNKIANKFGGYGFNNKKPEYTTEYINGEPEKIFKEKIMLLADKNKKVLDVGCGDGIFAFNLADYFMNVVGIDISEGLIEVAKEKQKELGINNCEFSVQDAENINFENDSFDLVFTRRGPTPYKEFYRLLKPGGYMCAINIGEKDTKPLQDVFGRGQGYGQSDVLKLNRDARILEEIGFKVVFAEEYFYKEYYPTYEEIDLFLQGVPIFKDFDSEKDRGLLEKYVSENISEKGVELERHRYVLSASKE